MTLLTGKTAFQSNVYPRNCESLLLKGWVTFQRGLRRKQLRRMQMNLQALIRRYSRDLPRDIFLKVVTERIFVRIMPEYVFDFLLFLLNPESTTSWTGCNVSESPIRGASMAPPWHMSRTIHPRFTFASTSQHVQSPARQFSENLDTIRAFSAFLRFHE
jgi:hypothetical protein